jgi:hypothetical protein
LHSRCSARKARPFTSAYVIATEAAASTTDDDGGEVAVAASAVAETLIEEEPTHDRGDGDDDDDDDDDDARCWKPVVGVIMDPLVTTATVRTHAFAELDRRIVCYFSYYRAWKAEFGWAGSLSMEEDFGLGCDHELRRLNSRISDRCFRLSTCYQIIDKSRCSDSVYVYYAKRVGREKWGGRKCSNGGSIS